MNSALYIFKIVLYYILVAFIYNDMNCDYKAYDNSLVKIKISSIKIIVYSALISLYAIYSFPSYWRGDHSFFHQRFTNYVSIANESPGLNFLFDIIHLFTNNSYIMFFCVIFVGTMLVFIGYRMIESATPITIVLLLLSEFFPYGFAALKQFVACGFSIVFFAFYIRKKYIRSFIFIILATVFHESAYILILFFLVFWFSEKLGATFTSLFLVVIPFSYNFLIKLAIRIFPSLEIHLSNYMNNANEISSSNHYMTLLKGLPFYVISLFVIINYSKYSKEISNYDLFMFCSISASIWVLISFNMYWFFRISYFFYFPAFIIIEEIYKMEKKNRDVGFYWIGVFLPLVFLTLKYIIQMFFKYDGL